MLYQPEFEDIAKLKQLMTMLNDTSDWRRIGTQENAVAVTTKRGAELTWFNDVAVVRSTFKVNENEQGQLMVVGPSRMDYDQIISMLQYAARMIEKMYNAGGKNE
jgi:heat-inducible transcriptional repressor